MGERKLHLWFTSLVVVVNVVFVAAFLSLSLSPFFCPSLWSLLFGRHEKVFFIWENSIADVNNIRENVLFLYFMFRFCTLHSETSVPQSQPQSYFKRMNGLLLLQMEMIGSVSKPIAIWTFPFLVLQMKGKIIFLTNNWKSKRNVIISIRMLANILISRYKNSSTPQFSSANLTFLHKNG